MKDGDAKSRLTAREVELCHEWDDLEKEDKNLADWLWHRRQELPNGKCQTGQFRVFFYGVTLGAFPCFAASQMHLPWKIAVASGFWICVIACCLAFYGWAFSSKNYDFSIQLQADPQKLNWYAVSQAARADACSRGWSEEEVSMVKRFSEIAHELNVRNIPSQHLRSVYFDSLATHTRQQYWEKTRAS